MVGMFVCLCLASQKPSEREFFVPARTNLGVKLLNKTLGLRPCPTPSEEDPGGRGDSFATAMPL
jgi:hypothetical protein